MKKVNLKDLSKTEIDEFIESIGEKSFRADQIWNWLYIREVSTFEEMTNISKELRLKLSEKAYISSLKLIDQQTSKKTGTAKFLWELEDGLKIESVYIPERQRHTVCISTQVGCPLGCTFCATAKMGYKRNLKVSEIVNQVMAITKKIGRKPTNIVVMGMGEPFLNYNNLMKALYILNNMDGLAYSHRRITISTAGLVPQIIRYAKEEHQFKLAVSLHATTDKTRSAIMPINRKFPLEELMSALKEYTKNTKNRITFEYILIDQINDFPEDGKRLLKMVRNLPCKINLISYNASGNKQYSSSSPARVHAFSEAVSHLIAPVTMRLSKGDDIKGACGQLAGREKEF